MRHAIPRAVALLLLAGSSLIVSSLATAAPSMAVDGLDLVLDPDSGARHLPELAPGETLEVHAVVRDLSFDAMLAFQIGLEIDPSLMVLGVQPHALAGAVVKPTLADLYVGLESPLLVQEGAHVLATWTLVRRAGFAPDDPATIRMRDLENGEASGYSMPEASYHRADFRDTGPLLIGPVEDTVLRFLAIPRDFVKDRSYEVEWETIGLTDLRLDGDSVAGAGTMGFTADASTEHVLSWETASGPEQLAVPVDVLLEPRVDVFAANPSPDLPSTYRVHWTVSGANAVWWEPGGHLITSRGERAVTTEETAVFTLRAENEWGSTRRTLVINATGEPVIGGFWVEPQNIDLGEESLLSWSVVDADRIVLDPLAVEVAPDGSRTVSPDTTTTYTLRAVGTGTEAVRSLTVGVTPLRIETFGVNPREMFPGSTTTLRWTIVNAEEAWIEPEVGPVDPVSGSLEIEPTKPVTDYILHARRQDEERTVSRTVRWKKPYAYLSASFGLMPQEVVELTASVSHADSARILPHVGWLSPPNGESVHRVPIDGPTRFVLEAYNAAGVTVDERNFDPPPPGIAFWHANTYYLGMRTRATVYVERATRLQVSAPLFLAEPFVTEDLNTEHGQSFQFDFWLDEKAVIRATAENAWYSTTDSLGFGQNLQRLIEAHVDDTSLPRGETTQLHWGRIDEPLWGHFRIEPLGHEESSAGSIEIQPEETTQYVVYGRSSSLEGTWKYRSLATVQVYDGETSLLAEPMRPVEGSTFDLHVSMPEDATAARIEPDIGEIEPHPQVLEMVAGTADRYVLDVETPRGTQTARLALRSEEVSIVPALVRQMDLSGRALRGRIALDWGVETTRPHDRLQLLRAAEGEELSPWRDLTSLTGEIIDTEVEVGSEYRYRLRVVAGEDVVDGDEVLVRATAALRTRLLPNVPNPFNPSTDIRWEVARTGHYRLDIHDLRGRRVRSTELMCDEIGSHSWQWDGRDQDGSRVAGGTYIVRLTGENTAVARKVVLTK